MLLIRILSFQKVGKGHEPQRCRIRHWMIFFTADKIVTMADFSQAVFLCSINKACIHTRTHTQPHTHTHTHTHTQTNTHTHTLILAHPLQRWQ